jgi:site-specific recombinase XerD
MAEVYRPSYTITDPTTGRRVKRKSRTWHIRYYTPDGVRHRVKGYRDKKATENKAAELERRGIRVDAGLVDPAEEHARRPLVEHADDFRRYLSAKGNTAEYVGRTLFRLRAVLDGCRFIKIADVQSSVVVEYLGTLRGQSKSVKTVNDYLAAVKGFMRWLWRDKRSALDPLAGLSKLANSETDVRHARRDFRPEELALLFQAARHSAETIRCLSGSDRHFLYLTACATGFRASELASLTPESFSLNGDTPTIKVQAACTKNRKEAVQPLPLDVAAVLRGYLASKLAAVPLWPDNPKAPTESWRLHGAEMIRRDLARARQGWLQSFHDARQRAEMEESDFLSYRDSEGRYADFHALRHSYISMIGRSGASPKEHQDLARHSTYGLTSRYTHTRFYDLAAVVRSLPIPLAASEARALQATGTEGPENLGPNLVLQPATSGDFQRQNETADTDLSQQTTPEKSRFSAFSGASCVASENYPQGDSNPCLLAENQTS